MKFSTVSSLSIFILCGFIGLTLGQTYQLVWSDEFTGSNLDTSKWQYEVNCDGGGNNELQCYTSNSNNLKVSDGYLTITAVPQSYNGKSYTSSRINTKASSAWKYGKFEIRAKAPNGAYLWPALWMMPRDSVYGGWAASGEIDIFEGKGQNVKEYQSTLHYGSSWPNNVYQGSGARTASADLTADFHVYTCTWTEDSISFALDGTTYYTRDLNVNFYGGKGTNPYTANRQPFDQYFYFIINLAVGGGFFGSESNALTTATAQKWSNPNLVVDYVRVYQLSSSVVVNPVVPVPTSAATSQVQTSTVPITTSSSSSACPNGCGSGSCCKDATLGGVCYSTVTHICVEDSIGLFHLCGKGLGYCAGACYNTSKYKCNNGALAQL